jgi:hypothetical protein
LLYVSVSTFGSGATPGGGGRSPVAMVCVAMDNDIGRVGGVNGSVYSPLSWLALRTELGRLALRGEPSPPSLREADPGRSTRRDMRLSSSSRLSARLGDGDTI